MDAQDQTILRRFILGVTLVILIGVVIWVFFGRDAGKKDTASKKETATATQKATEDKSSSSAASQRPGNTSQPQTNNPAANPAPGAGGGGSQPSHLADTGPGNAVVLFVGAAAAGTLGHYLFQRQRQYR